MAEYRTLPLGIDIGTTRLRIALAEQGRGGDVRLRAVAARDVEDEAQIPVALKEMRSEIGSRERRCVSAFGTPDVALTEVTLPRMMWAERKRAARFEAPRFAGWNVEDEPTLVRVHSIDSDAGRYAIGTVRRETLERRLTSLRRAGLRARAIDHDALALRRVLPEGDAIVDIGSMRSRVHVFFEDGFRSWDIASGGDGVTRGIASDLNIDAATAERRKRIVGSGGAGIAARNELVAAIARTIDRARERRLLERVFLCGNGARLPGFARALAAAIDCTIELPVPQVLQTGTYPPDVIRAAAPDWTLAAGLALWSAAA
jgi:Tfp pilus assembly PilM family ATPase